MNDAADVIARLMGRYESAREAIFAADSFTDDDMHEYVTAADALRDALRPPPTNALRDTLAEALQDLDLQEDASDAASAAEEILTRIQLRLKYPILGAGSALPPPEGLAHV